MRLDRFTVIYFGALVVAIILHEIAHGVVALWFGDDTARRAGRLTLNPVPHIDPFGSIILPAMGALAGVPVIGWAKPVPVNPGRLRNPRRDMLVVSLAGPAHELPARCSRRRSSPARCTTRRRSASSTLADLPTGVQIALIFAVVNLFLGLFNLLPIPPLDGAALLERVLPERWLPGWQRFRPYGVLVIFFLVFWGGVPRTRVRPVPEPSLRFVLR